MRVGRVVEQRNAVNFGIAGALIRGVRPGAGGVSRKKTESAGREIFRAQDGEDGAVGAGESGAGEGPQSRSLLRRVAGLAHDLNSGSVWRELPIWVRRRT